MLQLPFDTKNPKIDEVLNNVKEMINQYDRHSCLAFCDWVNKDLVGRDFAQKNREKLSRLIVHATFRSLSLQSLSVSMDLLSSGDFLDGAYLDGLDLHDVIRGVLITSPSLEQRDEWKKNMLQSLFRNPAVLFDRTNKSVMLGQWLQEYDAKASKNDDYALSFVEITSTKDFVNLSLELKEYLKQTLEIVRYLHMSSVNLQSDLEQMTAIGPSGAIVQMKGLEIQPIDDSDKSAREIVDTDYSVAQIKKSAKGVSYNSVLDNADKSRVYEADVLKYKVNLQNKRFNVDQILLTLFKSVLQRDVVSVVAFLSLLADKTSLSELSHSKFGAQILVNKQRSELVEISGVKDTVNIQSKIGLKIIMKDILIDKLSLTSSDSAHIASDLIAIARDNGEKIDHVSYFDESDGQYHWL